MRKHYKGKCDMEQQKNQPKGKVGEFLTARGALSYERAKNQRFLKRIERKEPIFIEQNIQPTEAKRHFNSENKYESNHKREVLSEREELELHYEGWIPIEEVTDGAEECERYAKKLGLSEDVAASHEKNESLEEDILIVNNKQRHIEPSFSIPPSYGQSENKNEVETHQPSKRKRKKKKNKDPNIEQGIVEHERFSKRVARYCKPEYYLQRQAAEKKIRKGVVVTSIIILLLFVLKLQLD